MVPAPSNVADYPATFNEFITRFGTEEACREYVEAVRWRDGFACPRCGAMESYWRMGDGLRRCTACRARVSATSGTIFDKTRYPLQTWFHVMWHVVGQKNGVSALGLQREIGMGSYQTAWAWMHKLRRAMVNPDRSRIGGPGETVEIDETFVGGIRSKARGGRSPLGKAVVAIAVDARPGRVRLERLPNTAKDTMTEFVLSNVERGSIVHTDAYAGYNDLGRYDFRHTLTNMSSADALDAHVSMPHAHRVASLLKRWLLGTHQGGMSREQLDYYLDEFTFRFNRRQSASRGLLFYRLVEGAVATPPKPYKDLKAGSDRLFRVS